MYVHPLLLAYMLLWTAGAHVVDVFLLKGVVGDWLGARIGRH